MLMLAVLSADENEFVQLGHKHNFSRCCFGVLLGMLHNNLEGGMQVQTNESSIVTEKQSMDVRLLALWV
jgi:hypothetical protein